MWSGRDSHFFRVNVYGGFCTNQQLSTEASFLVQHDVVKLVKILVAATGQAVQLYRLHQRSSCAVIVERSSSAVNPCIEAEQTLLPSYLHQYSAAQIQNPRAAHVYASNKHSNTYQVVSTITTAGAIQRHVDACFAHFNATLWWEKQCLIDPNAWPKMQSIVDKREGRQLCTDLWQGMGRGWCQTEQPYHCHAVRFVELPPLSSLPWNFRTLSFHGSTGTCHPPPYGGNWPFLWVASSSSKLKQWRRRLPILCSRREPSFDWSFPVDPESYKSKQHHKYQHGGV